MSREKDAMTNEPLTCTECGQETDPLSVFPGGICVDCYAKSPAGRREYTADEIAAMWGAR